MSENVKWVVISVRGCGRISRLEIQSVAGFGYVQTYFVDLDFDKITNVKVGDFIEPESLGFRPPALYGGQLNTDGKESIPEPGALVDAEYEPVIDFPQGGSVLSKEQSRALDRHVVALEDPPPPDVCRWVLAPIDGAEIFVPFEARPIPATFLRDGGVMQTMVYDSLNGSSRIEHHGEVYYNNAKTAVLSQFTDSLVSGLKWTIRDWPFCSRANAPVGIKTEIDNWKIAAKWACDHCAETIANHSGEDEKCK